MNILDVIIRRSVVSEPENLSVGIVNVPDYTAARLFRENGAAIQKVIRCNIADSLSCADTVGVIKVAVGRAATLNKRG